MNSKIREKALLVQSPSLPDREVLNGYIDEIYKSRWLTNNGHLVQELEKKLTGYLDVPYLVLTANGTSALQLALKLFNIDKEVITTPFTFAATGQAIEWVGAKPVFADIDKRSLCLCPKQVSNKISPHTQAILPVNVYGRTAHNTELEELARRHNLKLIYDGAQSFGPPSLHQKTALTSGDATALSFHATKIFNTVEGGALILKSEEDYLKAQSLINFGYQDGKPGHVGTNAKMNEIEAAFGLANLEHINKEIVYRKLLTEAYKDQLADFSNSNLLKLTKSPNYAYFPLQFIDEQMLLKVDQALKVQNVFGRRYFYPLQPGSVADDLPVASRVARNSYCLPLHCNMTKDDVTMICDTIRTAVLPAHAYRAQC
ncbi:DegT/DnrJ/EryC1/StrS family aminotransferase [Alginatibacterium sediminis]|uniref:DegT/DnrJ/EryC1/StrS family aminotransferase n=1 Tax=Alginatibacterium sediminis TaxID=2164068 RepID=A0A420EGG0_9ALTE|nr:DegT/DnrJ/EryC1/StrS family aminotransferase [Alginatibacterium sediminis]RKF19646.1 DegT/DnrJ/EryC1/StrS family aminotransferase [Alginatibacterium sediminis]